MNATDPFQFDDAAYVLGALTTAERVEFEAHLETCPECRERVAEARAGVDLLAGLTVNDIADAAPMPDTLLPGLLRAADSERRRRRWLTGSLAGLAAACLVALAVLIWPSSGSDSPDRQSFVALRSAPVTATARLVAHSWGTEIELECRYSTAIKRYVPYDLVVIDRHGHSYPAGSWTLSPGHTISFTGGTAVAREDIARVQITLADGTPILQLTN